MVKSKLTIIAAASTNNVIGFNNKLIWNIPNDLKRFKELTLGHSVIMGRKTFESLPNPLPKRRNIIVTKNKDYSRNGIEVTSNIEDAIDLCKSDSQPFIIGGGEIYSQTIEIVDKIELTRVYKDYQGDAFFPDIPMDKFELTNELVNYLDDDSSTKYSFLTYIRK